MSTEAVTPVGLPVEAITKPPQRERIAVAFDHDNPAAPYLDTGLFEQMQRAAGMLASSALVPAHLRNEYGADGKVVKNRQGDCFLVVAQAFRWKLDPFAVAQHTYVVSGKLGYEGKLIAALVNSSGKLDGSLRYEHSGDAGSARRVKVSGRLRGETFDRAIEGSVGGWKTDNKFWVSQPDQQLAYRGAREWARRHMPEVILGIAADEEVQPPTIDLTPSPSGRLEAPPSTPDPLLARVVEQVPYVPEPAPEGMSSHSDTEIPFASHQEADQALADEDGQGRLMPKGRGRRE